jgi:hypothetical protein
MQRLLKKAPVDGIDQPARPLGLHRVGPQPVLSMTAQLVQPLDLGVGSFDSCYVFHFANAYDHENLIVLHAVRRPELWRDGGGFDADGVLWS